METINVGVGKGKVWQWKEVRVILSCLPKNSNPYAKPFGVKCSICGEVGHRSNECPKRKVVNVMVKNDDVVENEVCGLRGGKIGSI